MKLRTCHDSSAVPLTQAPNICVGCNSTVATCEGSRSGAATRAVRQVAAIAKPHAAKKHTDFGINYHVEASAWGAGNQQEKARVQDFL